MSMPENGELLRIEGLRVAFPFDGGVVQAVDGVSYAIDRGETVAVVGESGSGKSVHALAIAGLVPRPPAIVEGKVYFEGRETVGLDATAMSRLRGRGIGFVFQEPMTSLNPLLKIGTQLTEGMRQHLGLSGRAARDRAVELLTRVGIPEPRARLEQYPHEFSGGMRQRVMIAMALACEPKLLIADEPTTALDVTIQAQILELMRELVQTLDLALLIITHNLGLVARYADRVNVMYAGGVVEHAATRELFASPGHPYTRDLLRSVPRLDRPKLERLEPIEGQPPDLARLPQGCRYRPRCTLAAQPCADTVPALLPLGTGQRRSACLRVDQLR